MGKPTRFPRARSVPLFPRSVPTTKQYSYNLHLWHREYSTDSSVAGADDGKAPDVRKHTSTIFETIDDIVKGASGGRGGIANLIDTVVWLTEMEHDHAGMKGEWNKVFEGRSARVTVKVKDLPDTRFTVEVKGVAVVPG